ncbi:MAG: hypothetical protein ACR2GJ_07940 [Gemmatimonadaceae bacterium]
MTAPKSWWLSVLAVGTVAATALTLEAAGPPRAGSRLCTLEPGRTLALIRVEQDTMLRGAAGSIRPMSASGVRAGPGDSLVATAETLMPAARVRLLQLDSATRGTLAASGITASQPVAFIRAAPYRADCRTIRWTDTVPFVKRGEVGYVRATLTPSEYWIDGVPLLVIPDEWNYPYPRRRGLVSRLPADVPLAPADAMFSLNAILEMPRATSAEARAAADSARRLRAMEWARANPAAAELEPVRALVRSAVLGPDWEAAMRSPSRLRGTYRVDMEVGDERDIWFFRTHERPGYGWRGADTLATTADLLASPYIVGYRLVGFAAGSPDSLLSAMPSGSAWPPLVWLATNDRPTSPGNDARRALTGELEFILAAAPERLWNDLEVLVPPRSAADSLLWARLNRPIVRGRTQPRIPVTVRLDANGGVRADTSLVVNGRALRVILQRVDTLSIGPRRGPGAVQE